MTPSPSFQLADGNRVLLLFPGMFTFQGGGWGCLKTLTSKDQALLASEIFAVQNNMNNNTNHSLTTYCVPDIGLNPFICLLSLTVLTEA